MNPDCFLVYCGGIRIIAYTKLGLDWTDDSILKKDRKLLDLALKFRMYNRGITNVENLFCTVMF